MTGPGTDPAAGPGAPPITGPAAGATAVRRVFEVRGTVQGVGFRPFVYRIAVANGLGGLVGNNGAGVSITVEGSRPAVQRFTAALRDDPPSLATIDRVTYTDEPIGVPRPDFAIVPSDGTGRGALIPPDSRVCAACLAELFDPDDRRYGYPLINCMECGPRYSIILDVPYDRPLTTMAPFTMCRSCAGEYASVGDRRFHAQPNACPVCGPRIRLLDPRGDVLDDVDPVAAAAKLLAAGRIVAVKAHGGFQLVVDAANETAVGTLRERKERGGKPFAVLAADITIIRGYAHVSAAEAELLRSPARPIVLLRRRGANQEVVGDDPDAAGATTRRDGGATGIADSVAPGLGTLGVMLPSTPTQHLLLASGFDLLVATSGNAGGEPMALTEDDVRHDLGAVCDAILTHERRIHHRVDDSIARVVIEPDGPRTQLVRRARGYVPRAVAAPFAVPPMLAVGPELKNTVCVAEDRHLFLSQHIGDLASIGNRAYFADTIEKLTAITRITPTAVAHDLHPGFHSTCYARGRGLPAIGVQHHHAHMAACMADNGLDQPVIGVIFDGTGYGRDGTIWGGEFLVGGYRTVTRAAHLGTFRLPGGDRAVTEPDRTAISLLHETFGARARSVYASLGGRRPATEADLLLRMCSGGVNAPVCSSAGRLFDGVSALLDICATAGYEAQAAILLEDVLDGDHTPVAPWPTTLTRHDGSYVIDVRPWIRAVVTAAGGATSGTRTAVAAISRTFHESIVESIVVVCDRLRTDTGIADVVLSGGVFLNAYLSTRVPVRLRDAGFGVYTHRAIPLTDGGVAAGQVMVAAARLTGRA